MSFPPTSIRLLVIDVDPETPDRVRALLQQRIDRPYQLLAGQSLDASLASFDRAAQEVVLLGIDTARENLASAALHVTQAIDAGVSPPVVLLGGTRNPEFEKAMLSAGAADFCWKDELSAPLLESQIRHALAYAAARAASIERQAVESALRESEAQLRVMLHEREALERRSHQSHKMETVGRLAGGIAHDFNNILTAIVGFGTLVSEQVVGNPAAERNAREILIAAERASSLTRQLLAFGRRQVLHPVRLNLNETVHGVAGMLGRVIGEDVDLQIKCATRIPPVCADQGQLESALMNLVVNARDAMPQGGRIIIETDEVLLDQSYCDAHISVRPGHYVRLAVSDNGIGIPIDVQHRIFEPFFTTKDAGKGTGLGLATVYGIIKQSGGYIWVYSEPGMGTTFKVYLPVNTSGRPSPVPGPKGSPEWSHGTETILLVEDAEIIRQLAREIIVRAGYRVLEAGDAEQALAVASAHSGHIDLLLTDVIMPGRSGVELATRLKSIRTDVNVLYMSGYTDNAIVRNGLLADEASFLQKPFTPEDLLRKVRQMLEVSTKQERL